MPSDSPTKKSKESASQVEVKAPKKKERAVRSESPETVLSESEPEQKPVVSRKKGSTEEDKIITSSRGKTSSKPKRPTEEDHDGGAGDHEEGDAIVSKVKEKKKSSGGKEAGIDDLPPISSSTKEKSSRKTLEKEGDPSITKELSKLKKKTMRDVEALDAEIRKLSRQ
jgi:hypothetical protein